MVEKTNSLKGKKIAVIVTDGIDKYLLDSSLQILNDHEADIRMVALKSGYVSSSKNEAIPIDYAIYDNASSTFDALYIPSLGKNIASVRTNKDMLHFICEIYSAGKNIALDDSVLPLLEAAVFNPLLSKISLTDLNNNGIFILTKNGNSIKYFIKAIAKDYPKVDDATRKAKLKKEIIDSEYSNKER